MSCVRQFKRPEVGEVFGGWTVIGHWFRTPTHNVFVPCRCECGTEKDVRWHELRTGATKSCGCRNKGEGNSNYRHGAARFGEDRSKLYLVWVGIKARCLNPKSRSYPNYGGRGITICEEWRRSFAAFRDWSLAHGYREGLWIDRIDNNGPYSPENCRWTTREESARNTRRNYQITAFGETKTLVEWSLDQRCRVYYELLRARVKSLGWEPERAITAPVNRNEKRQ